MLPELSRDTKWEVPSITLTPTRGKLWLVILKTALSENIYLEGEIKNFYLYMGSKRIFDGHNQHLREELKIY